MASLEEQLASGGQQKIEEYVTRIREGESRDSISQGLSPSFLAGIEAGLKRDAARLQEVRKNLGINSQTSAQTTNHEVGKTDNIEEMVKSVSEGRKQGVVDLYKRFFDDIENPETRKKLVSGLFKDIYNRYRIAEYPADPNEEQIWEDYLKKNDKVDVNNKNKEWMYRGTSAKNGEETVTRGSFNVNVTPELINSLDNMISSGKIKANYKFGQPGTPTSPTERHDSISIYFLEEPSDEILQELTQTIKPYVRGDNLLGKKIADGFYMSEIGSIETPHLETFVNDLKTKDVAFAEAVREYTSPQPGRGTSLKMSEAQFYAVKDVAKAFGYHISYNKENGFEIS